MARPQPGRPPLRDDDESTGVYVKLPSRAYDDLYERAKMARVSVPEFIRRKLVEPSNKNI